MKENGKKDKNTEKENMFGLLEISMKEIGLKID
jgi:hypothetical protein